MLVSMTRKFTESAKLQSAKGEGRYSIRLIKEGVSKNGANYLAATLERDGKTAWPAGTMMQANHDVEAPYTGGDIRNLVGFTLNDPEYVAGDGLWAEAQISTEWRQFVEDFKEVIGLSVVVMGDVEDTGFGPMVTALHADEYNSVDLVIAPAAGGAIGERLQESYHKITGKYLRESDATSVAPNNESEGMDEKQISALFEALHAKLAEGLTALNERLDKTIALAESAVAAAPVADEAFEAGIVAKAEGLSEAAVKRVKASAEKGIPLAEALKSEVEIRKEYLDESKREPEGHVHDNTKTERKSISEILSGGKN